MFDICIGDWIHFLQYGRLVIGEVQYVKTTGGIVDYYTSAGVCADAEVLAVRRLDQPSKRQESNEH